MGQYTSGWRNRVRRLEYLTAKAVRGGQVPGGGGGVTVASLTSASPQYTTLNTDRIIEVNVSGGQLAGPLLFDANPVIGEQHTVVSVGGNPSANPILVSGNGHTIEDPNSPQTFSSGNVAISSAGAVTWMFDGTRWIIVGSA